MNLTISELSKIPVFRLFMIIQTVAVILANSLIIPFRVYPSIYKELNALIYAVGLLPISVVLYCICVSILTIFLLTNKFKLDNSNAVSYASFKRLFERAIIYTNISLSIVIIGFVIDILFIDLLSNIHGLFYLIFTIISCIISGIWILIFNKVNY